MFTFDLRQIILDEVEQDSKAIFRDGSWVLLDDILINPQTWNCDDERSEE